MAFIHFSHRGIDYKLSESVCIGEYHYGYWKSERPDDEKRPYSWVRDTALVTRRYREWFDARYADDTISSARLTIGEMVGFALLVEAADDEYREWLEDQETQDDFLAGTGR